MRKTCFRIAWRWLVVNALVLLPLAWVVTSGLPVRLEVKVKAPTSQVMNLRMSGGGGEQAAKTVRSVRCAGRKEAQLCKLWMPVADAAAFDLQFEGARDGLEVLEIVRVERWALRKRLRMDEPALSDLRRTGCVRLSGPWQWRPDCKGLLALLGLEIALLLITALSTVFRREERGLRQLAGQSLPVALFAAVFYALVLPVQSYLVNQSSFGFSLDALLVAGAWRAAAAFLVAWVSLTAAGRCWGRTVYAGVVFFMIYEYLETGLLAFDHPALNGETVFFQNAARRFCDTFVLLGLVGAGILCAKWLKSSVHWIALAFLTLSLLSLFDVRTEPKRTPKDFVVSDFVSKTTLLQNAVYSGRRNVMVFVLDMATSEVVEDALGRDSELRGKFDGFVVYRNNVGMHMCTLLGSAGLLTGKYLERPSEMGAYQDSIFTSKSLIADYLPMNVPIFVSSGSMPFGYTNRRAEDRTEGEDSALPSADSPFTARIRDLQEWNLFEIVRFRASPFICKDALACMTGNGWTGAPIETDEGVYYGSLAKAPVDATCPMTLHWHHTDGCHPPLRIDRDGHLLAETAHGYDGCLEKAWYALRQLGRLLDVYRQRGLYDNSTIIVCADHGGQYENGKSYVRDGMTPKGLPMLWVKPERSRGAVDFSVLPTAHAKIAEVVRRLRTGPMSRSAIEAVLRSDDRFYRESSGSDFLDWHVDGRGHVEKRVVKASPEAEKLHPVEIGKMYFSDVKGWQDMERFIFEDVDVLGAGSMRMPRGVRHASFICRVADPSETYSVRIGLLLMPDQTGGRKCAEFPDPHLELSAKATEPCRVDFRKRMRETAVLDNVRPDANGFIRITMTRKGLEDMVFFSGIQVAR